MKIKKLKTNELFRRDRFNITFSDIKIPTECVKSISSIIRNNDEKEWNNIFIVLEDEIGIKLSEIIKNQGNTPFSFLLEKLDPTGETVEELTVIGHIHEYDLGGFGYIHNLIGFPLNLMGIDYSVPSEITLEFSIKDMTIVNKIK